MPAVAKKEIVKKEVKKPNMKKEVKEPNMKKEVKETNMTKEDLVEYHRQLVTLADKEKMEPIIKFIKRYAIKPDLRNFVANFSEFLSEGTLEIKRYKKRKCFLCRKYGHPAPICPMHWKDGEWIQLCYVCKEGGLPHPECDQDCCLFCYKKCHTTKNCPEEKKSPAELEKQEEIEGTKTTGAENKEQNKEEENKPVEEENETKPVPKKKRKKNKRPLQENKEESVSSTKKDKKKKTK